MLSASAMVMKQTSRGFSLNMCLLKKSAVSDKKQTKQKPINPTYFILHLKERNGAIPQIQHVPCLSALIQNTSMLQSKQYIVCSIALH